MAWDTYCEPIFVLCPGSNPRLLKRVVAYCLLTMIWRINWNIFISPFSRSQCSSLDARRSCQSQELREQSGSEKRKISWARKEIRQQRHSNGHRKCSHIRFRRNRRRSCIWSCGRRRLQSYGAKHHGHGLWKRWGMVIDVLIFCLAFILFYRVMQISLRGLRLD